MERQRAFSVGLAGILCAAISLADQPAPERSESGLVQLEALVQAQQRRIDDLQSRIAARSDTGADAQRAAWLREQVRQILAEPEFRDSLMAPTLQAGYDRGFFIRSADENFSLKLNGHFQFRWTHTGVQSRNRYDQPRLERDDRTGFDLNRLRLLLTGNIYTQDLTYYLNIRAEASTEYDAQMYDAFVNYRFSEALQFQSGIFKAASTLARATSDKELQFPDRPLVNDVFEISRVLGLRLWGTLCAKRVEWYLDVFNSWNDYRGRVITPDPAELDNNPGLAARLVWQALGEKPGKDLAGESDLEILKSPALAFYFHYGFNEDDGDRRTTRIPFPRASLLPGGFGRTTTNGLQIHQFGWASAFKYCGFSARGEYILRLVDVRQAWETPVAPWFQLTGDCSTVAQHGAYLQAGYMLPIPGFERKFELVGRVGGISTLADEHEGVWEYSGGINYFIKGHNVKLQADVTKVYEAPISTANVGIPNINDDALIFRVQLQVAF